MRPGVLIEQVQAAVVETITKAGFEEYYRHRSGYSIGIGFPPDWGEGRTLGIREGESQPIQPGTTFHITPGAAIKTVVGVGVTETVVVTEHGAESLIEYPRELQVKVRQRGLHGMVEIDSLGRPARRISPPSLA